MAFRLDPRRALAPQLRMLLIEQCADALETAHQPTAASIHDIRRCSKRSRSLLRLVRPGLKGRIFKRLNRAWRDLGRLMSTLRDHTVLHQSLSRLAKRYPDVLAPAVFQQLRKRLKQDDKPFTRVLRTARIALGNLHEELRCAKLKVHWQDAAAGHARCHADYLVIKHRALKRGRANDRHAWRKRVTDLAYQARLLALLWPGINTGWDDLGSLLGQEHDVAMLRHWLAETYDVPGITRVCRQAHQWQRHLRVLSDRLARGLPDDPDLTRLQVLGARQAVA